MYKVKELFEKNMLSMIDENQLRVNKDYFFDYTEEDIERLLGRLLLSLTNSNVTSSIISVPLIEDNPIHVGLCVFRDENSIRETFKNTTGGNEPVWVSLVDIIQAFKRIYDPLKNMAPIDYVIIQFCLNFGVDPDIILKAVK